MHTFKRMKSYILPLLVIVVCLLGNKAFAFKSNIKVSSYYSYDYLRWSIPLGRVNIGSELTWNDVHVVGFNIEHNIFFSDYYFDASFSYGFMLSGKNQDSDYNFSDRKGEFSRSNNDSTGNVLSLYLGIGPSFDIKERNLMFIPLVGLFFKRGHYRIFNGYQTVSGNSLGTFKGSPVGHIHNLSTTYTNNWIGVWGGTKLTYSPIKVWSLDFLLRLSVSYYYATADWNLRKDFQHPKSFSHHGFGIGSYISLASNFRVSDSVVINLTLFFDGLFVPFQGMITAFYSGVGRTPKGEYHSALNNVISLSAGANLGFVIIF